GHRPAPPRHGSMAARAAQRRAQPAELLFRHLNRVELAAAHKEAEAAELAERVANSPEQLCMALRHVARPVIAAALLVADEEQQYVARQRGPLRPGAQKGGEEHGDAALHVEGAPPVHEAAY